MGTKAARTQATRAAAAAVIATGLGLALGACGGSNGGTNAAVGGSHQGGASPTGSQSSAGSSSSSSSSSSSGGAVSANFDLCKVMTAADASRITGVHFTKAKTSSVMGQVFSCEYSGGTFNLLQVSVDVKIGMMGLQNDVQILGQVGHKPDTVSGVGDAAYSMPDPSGNAGAVGASAYGSYGAVFGSDYIKIGGLSYVTADQGKQIVELIHSKI